MAAGEHEVLPLEQRGPRALLTRSEVLDAALDFVDARGLEALSFRKLAAALGVSTMTLYSYLADKADLLNAMVRHALGVLALDPQSDDPWDVQLETAMRGMHDALEQHPGVVELLLVELDQGPLDGLREALVEMLIAAGLSRRQSSDALRTLSSYIIGTTVVNRVRSRASGHRTPRESFDHGFVILMEAVRREVAAAGKES
jgi:AcrR family transcriptional regulator